MIDVKPMRQFVNKISHLPITSRFCLGYRVCPRRLAAGVDQTSIFTDFVNWRRRSERLSDNPASCASALRANLNFISKRLDFSCQLVGLLYSASMQTTQSPKAGERTQEEVAIEAEPIMTSMAKLYPNMKTDTCAGQPGINRGSMFMQITSAKATIKRDGKKVEIGIGAGMNGATILYASGRYFVLDLGQFIQHAIDSGLLADTLDFNRA